jgi:DNA-binding transcriptional LysR family regulator
VSRATEKVRRTASGEQGRISVGVTPTGPFHPFVPQVIRAFRDAYPLVSVTIEEWASNELVERLRAEQIDVAFIRTLPADASAFAVNPCLGEELIAVLPKGHALVQGRQRPDTTSPLSPRPGERRPSPAGARPRLVGNASGHLSRRTTSCCGNSLEPRSRSAR